MLRAYRPPTSTWTIRLGPKWVLCHEYFTSEIAPARTSSEVCFHAMKRARSSSIYECIAFLTEAVQGGAILFLAVVQAGPQCA
jgi:hypothetical protein